MKNKGLYVHIPFCKYICTYCDFCKKYIKKQNVELYIHNLIKELEMSNTADVTTIFIGGGTPSSIGLVYTSQLLTAIAEIVDLQNVEEYSVEVNPDDVTDELMSLYQQHGINRISIGVQTLNDDILKQIKREHTKQDVQNAIDIASQYFDNISIDLIFNLPNQTLDDINDSFEFIKANVGKIKHVSYYSMILEENTIMSYNNEEGPLTEDEESEIYLQIQQMAANLGFVQYEISNYALPGFHSKHNLKYWTNDPYLGIGLGAAAYDGVRRTKNTQSINAYNESIANNELPIVENNQLTSYDFAEEKIFLRLRTNLPVEIDDKLLTKINDDLQLKQYLEIKENTIKIKPKYYFVSNEIIIKILEFLD